MRLSILKGSAKAATSKLLCFLRNIIQVWIPFVTNPEIKPLNSCRRYHFQFHVKHIRLIGIYTLKRNMSPSFHLHHFLLVHLDHLVVPANKKMVSVQFGSIKLTLLRRNEDKTIGIRHREVSQICL